MESTGRNIKDEFGEIASDDDEDYVLKNIGKCAGSGKELKNESFSDVEKCKSSSRKKRKLTLSDAMEGYETDDIEEFTNSTVPKFDDDSEEEVVDEDSDIPVCWSRKQLQSFQEKYIYLTTKKGKLGCSICAQVKSLGAETGKFYHVSKQWRNSDVKCNGHSKATKQASLRKKLSEHFSSSSHMRALRVVQGRETEMRNGIDMSDFDTELPFQNFVEIDIQTNMKEDQSNTQTTSISPTPAPRTFRRKRPTKQQFLNYMKKKRAEDDEYEAIGKIVAAKLRKFPKCQKLIAERLLHELLYQGQVSALTTNSIIYTPSNKVIAAAMETKNTSSEHS